MNYDILYEFRLDNKLSYILGILQLIYLFKDTPLPKNIFIDSKIKKIYFIGTSLFVGFFIFIFFNAINFFLFVLTVFEIINSQNIIKKNKEIERQKQIEIQEKIKREKDEKRKILDSQKKVLINEDANKEFTLEECVAKKTYDISTGKQLANPTPKYQAILPDFIGSYL